MWDVKDEKQLLRTGNSEIFSFIDWIEPNRNERLFINRLFLPQHWYYFDQNSFICFWLVSFCMNIIIIIINVTYDTHIVHVFYVVILCFVGGRILFIEFWLTRFEWNYANLAQIWFRCGKNNNKKTIIGLYLTIIS